MQRRSIVSATISTTCVLVSFSLVRPSVLDGAIADNAVPTAVKNGDPKAAFGLLLAGLQSNRDNFHHGQGVLVRKDTGLASSGYLGTPAGVTKTITADFAFAGDKFRYDSHEQLAPTGQSSASIPPHDIARRQVLRDAFEYDSEVLIDRAKNSAVDVHSLQPRDVYVRTRPGPQGALTGTAPIDPKYLMEPFGMPLQRLRELMDDDGTKTGIVFNVVEVTDQADGTVTAKVRASGNNQIIETSLTFDPSRGYAVVREEGSLNGMRTYTVVRAVNKTERGWFLQSMKNTLYLNGDDSSPSGESVVTLEKFNCESEIPERTFLMEGMGLAENVIVHDTTAGVKYEPGLTKAVDAAVQTIVDQTTPTALQNGHSASRPSPTTQSTARESPDRPVASARQNRPWKWVAGSAAALLVIAFVAVAIRQRAASSR